MVSSRLLIWMVFFGALGLSIPAIYTERFFNIVPFHYVFYYIFSLLVIAFGPGKVKLGQLFSFYLAFFSFYFIFSMFITTDLGSTLLYYCLWISNLLVFLAFKNVTEESLKSFSIGYIYFVIFSLIVGLAYYFAGASHANPYVAWDKNNFSFVVFVAFVLAIFTGKRKAAYFIVILSVFIFSRTLIFMYAVFLLAYIFRTTSNKVKLLGKIFLFFIVIFVVAGLATYLAPDNFLVKRMAGAFALMVSIFEYFKSGSLQFDSGIDDWRRYYLMIFNMQIIYNTFPVGTGMGLANYLNYFNIDGISLVGRPARAHSFVISYLAEMGVLFFVFIFLIYLNLTRSKSAIFFAASVGVVAGMLTNEYITAPMIWMLFGLALNRNIANFNLKKNV